jgi:hypothetical protein
VAAGGEDEAGLSAKMSGRGRPRVAASGKELGARSPMGSSSRGRPPEVGDRPSAGRSELGCRR